MKRSKYQESETLYPNSKGEFVIPESQIKAQERSIKRKRERKRIIRVKQAKILWNSINEYRKKRKKLNKIKRASKMRNR